MVRQISGRLSNSSWVIAPSRNATTTPDSNRLRVCKTPRDRLTVSKVAPAAPRHAAPVTPSLAAHARPSNEASAAIRLKVTPSAAPGAVPSR